MMASMTQRSMDVSLCMAGLEKGMGLRFDTSLKGQFNYRARELTA